MSFKIWKLSIIEDNIEPWYAWWDEISDQVIIAETEEKARQLAAANCEPEKEVAWLSDNRSTCSQIELNKEHVVLVSKMWT